VVKMNVQPASFANLDESGIVRYHPGLLPLTHQPRAKQRTYSGHAAVIVGYRSAATVAQESPVGQFVVASGYGRTWGDGGLCYVPTDVARHSFTAAYGLLTGDDWAHLKGAKRPPDEPATSA